ncbi:MAG: FtsQ-type POTRA domain-containing protein [Cohaesibacter sp.]|nr:FtsQ-type POTRA domain-containing protein [Cohaesibacter sp.]MCV6603010.1 FtsQ-type POTRA domain-containing protein [Cohaesibacter sp.]
MRPLKAHKLSEQQRAMAAMGKEGQSADPLLPRAVAYEQRRLPLYKRIIPLAEAWLPRGIGWGMSVGFLGLTCLYGAMIGGSNQTALERVSSVIGLKVESVLISGQKEVSEAEILNALSLNSESSLLTFDAYAARKNLEQISWIAEAKVQKLYPNKLQIVVEEQKPFALWQRGQYVSLIAYDGSVISDRVEPAFKALPLVVGHGAQRQASLLFELLSHYPSLARKIRAVAYVGERRWDLYLKNGVFIKLPEYDLQDALDKVMAFDEEGNLSRKDIISVDLRLKDRTFVRMGKDAAEKRRAVLRDLGAKLPKEVEA